MGVHEHEARTKSDRLIAAVEALTIEVRKLTARLDGGGSRMIPTSVWYGKVREASAEVIADDMKEHGPISQAVKSAS